MDLMTSLTSRMLNKAMDGLAQRHTAIASNLANVETPGYRRHDVQFENALVKAIDHEKQKQAGLYNAQRPVGSNDSQLQMKISRPDHFPIGQSEGLDDLRFGMTEADSDVAFRNDGNTVDLEGEMAQLAKNTQRYNALANIEGRRGKAIRSILTS